MFRSIQMYCSYYKSWAYHIGHFLTSLKYGALSGQFNEQGIGYANNNPVGGLNSNLNLLEDFSPLRVVDPFRWIPQGLYYDLMDTRNETKLTGGSVNDAVSNFTLGQLFNGFQSDIVDISQYRARFLQQNPGNQTSLITNLFTDYGY